MVAPLDIGAMRDALADGLAVLNINVLRAAPDVRIIPPAIVVMIDDPIDYHKAFQGGMVELAYRLRVIAQGDTTGLMRIDRWRSAGTGQDDSVLDAVMAMSRGAGATNPPTAWSDIVVDSCGPVSAEFLDGDQTPIYTAVFSGRIISPRT